MTKAWSEFLRWGTVVACLYEAYSLVSGVTPPITRLIARFRYNVPVAGPFGWGFWIGACVVHFVRAKP